MALPMKKAPMKAAAMKKATKAMKAAKAMKAMKAMKAKRVSVIAKGKRARSAVFAGRKEKTVGGMTKAKLTKNKVGRIVSKAQSASSKRRYASTIGAWNKALDSARKELDIHGFVLINSGAQGKALYAKAQALYRA